MNNISNKSILIVGANGAIAKETIKHLLIDGAIEIVMACRSETRGLEALEEIKLELSEAKKASISVVGGFDMTVPDKIEIAVNALST
ncbi:MAG: KR domain-containing protein, partial [Saprospiraceae bacterium]|nr:KR domain-containing protein [Saprospiraceae bacterium]